MGRNNDCDLNISETSREEVRSDQKPWDGIDRRKAPYHYEVMEMIREEMEERDERILRRLETMTTNQESIKKKIDQWETGAAIVRWMAISTVGVVSVIMASIDWIKEHIR